MNAAVLALEDGTVFEGSSFGAPVERTGEVVFNTAITGYQEVFTDPSYSGQIVVLTNPQIGNYGANESDNEAARPYIEGLVVREFSPLASNWRADETAQQFLTANQVPVVAGIDTRALVRHLRSRGVMRGVLSAKRTTVKELVECARNSPSMTGLDLATRVSTAQRYDWTKRRRSVLALRSGIRRRPAALSCGRLRFRNQAQYSAALGPRRMPRHRGSRRHNRRRCARPEAERRVLIERSGRSGAAGISGRPDAQIDRPGSDVRHLPGSSDPGAGARRQDLQTEVRPSRRESSGAEQDHWESGNHLAQPRLRRRPRFAEFESNSKSPTPI